MGQWLRRGAREMTWRVGRIAGEFHHYENARLDLGAYDPASLTFF
jgi:hypothetical protein